MTIAQSDTLKFLVAPHWSRPSSLLEHQYGFRGKRFGFVNMCSLIQPQGVLGQCLILGFSDPKLLSSISDIAYLKYGFLRGQGITACPFYYKI